MEKTKKQLEDENARLRYKLERAQKQNGWSKDKGEISDGYHTFNELYEHRTYLFSLVVSANKEAAQKSKKHSDGSSYDDMFLVEIKTPNGNYGYHCDMRYWDWFDCKEVEFADPYDGYKPSDYHRLDSLKE